MINCDYLLINKVKVGFNGFQEMGGQTVRPIFPTICITVLPDSVRDTGYFNFLPVVISGFYGQKMVNLGRGTGPRLLSMRC